MNAVSALFAVTVTVTLRQAWTSESDSRGGESAQFRGHLKATGRARQGAHRAQNREAPTAPEGAASGPDTTQMCRRDISAVTLPVRPQ